MRRAADFILTATAGRTLDEYRADELLRSAVERKFEIVGEGLNRLDKSDPALAGQIPQHRQIISFRNVLIHGYDVVDEAVVWQIVQADLPALKQKVDELLSSLGP